MFSRLFALYRTKPQNPVGDDGRMALADHFRELRARLLRAITVLVIAIIVALIYYDPIFEFVTSPYRDALESYTARPFTSYDKKTPEQRNIDARNESTSYEAPPPKPTANPNDQGEPERRTDTPG